MIKNTFLMLALLLCAFTFSTVQAESKKEEEKNIIYEVPTLKALSQLYWALLKFDPAENEYIDNFLMINECDLYRDYVENEFEWNGIRESAREFVVTNRTKFSTNFELLQPLRFAEYDLKEKTFDVWEPYKITAVRRFEVLAEDLFEDVCNKPYGHHINGYPKGLFVELNRPFTLDKIPVDPDMAEVYIREQIEIKRKKGGGTRGKTKKDTYQSRAAYLVMKMRVFSYKEEIQSKEYKLAKVLAVLEGYEIYGDRDRKMLLFSENFRRKKERSKMEVQLKKRYQARLKKQMEEKRKAAAEDGEQADSPE